MSRLCQALLPLTSEGLGGARGGRGEREDSTRAGGGCHAEECEEQEEMVKERGERRGEAVDLLLLLASQNRDRPQVVWPILCKHTHRILEAAARPDPSLIWLPPRGWGGGVTVEGMRPEGGGDVDVDEAGWEEVVGGVTVAFKSPPPRWLIVKVCGGVIGLGGRLMFGKGGGGGVSRSGTGASGVGGGGLGERGDSECTHQQKKSEWFPGTFEPSVTPPPSGAVHGKRELEVPVRECTPGRPAGACGSSECQGSRELERVSGMQERLAVVAASGRQAGAPGSSDGGVSEARVEGDVHTSAHVSMRQHASAYVCSSDGGASEVRVEGDVRDILRALLMLPEALVPSGRIH